MYEHFLYKGYRHLERITGNVSVAYVLYAHFFDRCQSYIFGWAGIPNICFLISAHCQSCCLRFVSRIALKWMFILCEKAGEKSPIFVICLPQTIAFQFFGSLCIILSGHIKFYLNVLDMYKSKNFVNSYFWHNSLVTRQMPVPTQQLDSRWIEIKGGRIFCSF